MSRDYWTESTSDYFREFWIDPSGQSLKTPYEDIEPALRFGWNRALAAEYPNETWEEIEMDLERMWNEEHPQHGIWSEIKLFVHDSWMRARSDWQGLAKNI